MPEEVTVRPDSSASHAADSNKAGTKSELAKMMRRVVFAEPGQLPGPISKHTGRPSQSVATARIIWRRSGR